jgi:hypothetical protein
LTVALDQVERDEDRLLAPAHASEDRAPPLVEDRELAVDHGAARGDLAGERGREALVRSELAAAARHEAHAAVFEMHERAIAVVLGLEDPVGVIERLAVQDRRDQRVRQRSKG